MKACQFYTFTSDIEVDFNSDTKIVMEYIKNYFRQRKIIFKHRGQEFALMNKPHWLFAFLFSFYFFQTTYADIAPSPIRVQGIYTNNECKIKMVSELVNIQLFRDSSAVFCTFQLQNMSDSISLEIGFPVMNFFYWSTSQYTLKDKERFNIYVNNRLYSKDQIQVPLPMKNIFSQYMNASQVEKEYLIKLDSINNRYGTMTKRRGIVYPNSENAKAAFEAQKKLWEWKDSKSSINSNLWHQFDSLMKEGNYPWYVWNVHFDSLEKKTIKVEYYLPCGMGYGDKYRYFNYLLETGEGWADDIDTAEINILIKDFALSRIDSVSPAGFAKTKKDKMLQWILTDLEPTKEDNIYLEYSFGWSKFKFWYYRKFKYWVNPVNWIRRAKYKRNSDFNRTTRYV